MQNEVFLHLINWQRGSQSPFIARCEPTGLKGIGLHVISSGTLSFFSQRYCCYFQASMVSLYRLKDTEICLNSRSQAFIALKVDFHSLFFPSISIFESDVGLPQSYPILIFFTSNNSQGKGEFTMEFQKYQAASPQVQAELTDRFGSGGQQRAKSKG